MVKLDRNDPCPCGSGPKYKKCCLGQVQGPKPLPQPGRPPNQDWDLDNIRAMSALAIMAELKDFGVVMTEKEFIRQAPDFSSAVELAENWYGKYTVTARGLDEDFIWMAATVLWPRLTPQVMSHEELDDMMQRGYELSDKGRPAEGCDLWLEV